MKDLSALTAQEAKAVTFLLTDVDDTITSDGELRPVALAALYRLREAGIRTILITGGSAGWGDIYLRQWPVEAVITESGAASLYRKDGAIVHYIHPSIDQGSYAARREEMIASVARAVPEAKLSSDQFARLFDVAFDHSSEPPYLSEEQITEVVAACKASGAETAVSSIHVNAWFGAFDKWEGTRSFFQEILGVEEAELIERSCYCGDAPNDQVMFDRIPLSFGVGNIRKTAHQMEVLPQYIAVERGGEGFAEIVDALLEKREERT